MRTTTLTTKAVSTTTALLLPAAPDRVQVQFHPPQGAQVVSIGTLDTTAAGVGMTLSQTTGPIVLRREDVGDAVGWPWYAAADIVGGRVTILEVFEPNGGRQ